MDDVDVGAPFAVAAVAAVVVDANASVDVAGVVLVVVTVVVTAVGTALFVAPLVVADATSAFDEAAIVICCCG